MKYPMLLINPSIKSNDKLRTEFNAKICLHKKINQVQVPKTFPIMVVLVVLGQEDDNGHHMTKYIVC